MHILHESLLIVESQGLWIFQIDRESFARYAGSPGESIRDGRCRHAVFQNITATCTFQNHVFVADANWIRIVDTQAHTVQTLSLGCTPVHITAIAFLKTTLYVADDIENRLWSYNLDSGELLHQEVESIQDLCIHDDKLWILQHGTLNAFSEESA